MLYLDTSLLVAAFTHEVQTDRIQAWLKDQTQDELVISDWVTTEFSSALSIKLRTRQIAVEHRARALVLFTRIYADGLTVLPVSRTNFRTAAGFADHHHLSLRASDALHLAICADTGATLCTLDRRLAEAGAALGVPTLLL